jgi:hypothetical protein
MLAYGDRKTWAEYVKMWSDITGTSAILENVTVVEHAKLYDGGFGEEMGVWQCLELFANPKALTAAQEMYGYMRDFGYHGGDPSVTLSENVGPVDAQLFVGLTNPNLA